MWQEREAMEIKDLQKLLSELTLEEKVGQMIQIPAVMLAEGGIITGPTDTVEMTEEKMSLVGSILGKAGAKDLRKVQDEFMAKHPHHIPLLLMYDVINGMETIFPIPLAQGCTFSPEMVEACAKASAREAAAKGLHVTFSPMLDLVRDARWGRVMESPGEDPWLNSQMGKAMVRGYQGSSASEGEEQKLNQQGNIAGCIKHFAAYGNPDGGRDYDNVELTERTLREDYLTAYKAAVEEGCAMVMTSFNALNRIPASGNQWLMRKVLREEMGFEGVLISDYNAVGEMIVHGFAEDSREAAKLAILAGVDMDMVSNAYVKYLAELVQCGEVEERLIDEAVWRILKLKNDLGLFENPYKDGDEQLEKQLVLCEEHRQLARQAASASFVLLKNEQLLPLDKKSEEKVALIGPYIDNVEIFGGWSFPENPNASVTIRQGADRKKSGLVYAKGCFVLDEDQCTRYHIYEEYTKEQLEQLMEEAVSAAKTADKVVLCLGEHRNQSGEGGSRACIQLPKHQMELLRAVKAVNDNIITVVFSGRPIEMQEITELSKAAMMVWMPGTEGGNAIADVLFGDAAPEGRLSMSLPRSVAQAPIYYNKYMTGRPNPTGTSVTFCNGYIDESTRPLYPFGYGLSYSEFAYGEVKLDQDKMNRDGMIKASVTLTNTGSVEATETVQLYLRDVKGSVIRPIKMLRGVQKVKLASGESREVTFEIKEDILKFYDINMEYVSETGLFHAFIGPDSDTENMAAFQLI